MNVAVLAVDGGNSKTDVCLVSAHGQLLGYARGPGSNHQIVGLDAAFDVLAGLVSEVRTEAGIDAGSTLAQHAAVYLAGADFPREVDMLLARVSLAGWAIGTGSVHPSMIAAPSSRLSDNLANGNNSPSAFAICSGVNCDGA